MIGPLTFWRASYVLPMRVSSQHWRISEFWFRTSRPPSRLRLGRLSPLTLVGQISPIRGTVLPFSMAPYVRLSAYVTTGSVPCICWPH
jgi:hypothetical protein